MGSQQKVSSHFKGIQEKEATWIDHICISERTHIFKRTNHTYTLLVFSPAGTGPQTLEETGVQKGLGVCQGQFLNFA